jgi:4-hydroxy-2-oxoheptanedioate aldolase
MAGRAEPSLLQRLRVGETLAGMQSFAASPVLVEAMGHAGLDFTIVDMEHCPTGLETLAHLLRAAEASGLVPLVRVPELDASLIGRVLDLGTRGIVLPHASPARCAAALSAARYAPAGSRGACPVVRAAGYLPSDWQAYASTANDEVLVLPLIEDATAVEEIEAILDIEGIDIVFVGPFDLAISLGLPGADYRHAQLAAILARIVRAARERGKFVMTTVGATIDHDYAASLVAAGVRLLSFSADVAVFFTACRRIARLRDGKA